MTQAKSDAPAGGSETTLDNGDSGKNLDEILGKYLELKRQARGLEKSIKRVEEELNLFFEHAGKNKLTTKYGLLDRQIINGRREWVIEI